MIEQYIMEDLDELTAKEVNKHLNSCRSCTDLYQDELKIIKSLKSLKSNLKVKEEVLSMGREKIKKSIIKNKKLHGFRIAVNAAACIFLVTSVISCSVIAFPSFAADYASALPVVKEMVESREAYDNAKKEAEIIKKENNELKMQLKKIEGIDIKEIQTSEGISSAENEQVQQLVIRFIQAQYRGDIESIKEMCTEEFKASIDSMKSSIIKEKSGDLIFSTITNVAKEGDKYLVFVRLSDGITKDEGEYQENFELKKTDGKFFVSFVGNDA